MGGTGVSGHHIPQILEWGHSSNFEHKNSYRLACSCIASSLSHCVSGRLTTHCLSGGGSKGC